MHILELPSFFPPYGGLFCLEQARALKVRGHEVRILSCTQLGYSIDKDSYIHANTDRKWVEMDGVQVYQTFTRGIPKAVRFNTWRWLSIVKSMFREYVERFGKPDVIHAHCCKLAGVAAYRLSLDYNIPYFITEHLPSELYIKDFGDGWTKHVWLKSMIKEAFEKANCVIPVANELVEDIAPFFGKDYRFREISNIIDTDFFAYKQRSTDATQPYRYCCLAVADIHRKGYDVLAKAWKDMRNAELHIAGNGTDSEAMRNLFVDCPNVTFYGSLDKQQVRELLYKSNALVLPSRSEAQPLVILEAMATGIPVVSTECVPESERIPGACLIAKTGDAEDLSSKMFQVRHVICSEEISRNAAEICSPSSVAKEIEKVFESYSK